MNTNFFEPENLEEEEDADEEDLEDLYSMSNKQSCI